MSLPSPSPQLVTIPVVHADAEVDSNSDRHSDSDSEWLLEGLFDPPEDDGAIVVMAPPHPLYGGNMGNPVVGEVADACHRAGLASLRFNWRGIGASTGTPTSEPEVGVADYAAALAFALESGTGSVAACGYSFGAASAVMAGGGIARVNALLLVAPPLVMLNRDVLKSFPGRILLIAGDRDEYAPLDDLAALCSDIENAELIPLPGTDHYFTTGLEELGRAAESFLQSAA